MSSCANDLELEAMLRNRSGGMTRMNALSSIGISFKNIVSGESIPDKLSYELRNADKWDTRSLYPPVEPTGPYFQGK